jgi:peptidyl-dipeptidase A
MPFDGRESGIARISRDPAARANLRGNDMKHSCSVFLVALLLSGCSHPGEDDVSPQASDAQRGPAETADEFIARINDELAELGRELGAAGWVRATYITEDTALLQSRARERYAEWHSNAVRQAMQYQEQELAPETRRAIDLVKLGTSLPSPSDADKRRELMQIATEMKGL